MANSTGTIAILLPLLDKAEAELRGRIEEIQSRLPPIAEEDEGLWETESLPAHGQRALLGGNVDAAIKDRINEFKLRAELGQLEAAASSCHECFRALAEL